MFASILTERKGKDMTKKAIVLSILALMLIACAAVGLTTTPTLTVIATKVPIKVTIVTPVVTIIHAAVPTLTPMTPTADSLTETLPAGKYPWHEEIIATVFWVGEEAGEENDFIDNIFSAWMTDWVSAFGGVDTPDERNPQNVFHPAGFTPRENSFYLALPASEFDETGVILGAREASPWTEEPISSEESLFKNRWVEVMVRTPDGKSVSCFGQWEDTGPGFDLQYEYVFGNAPVDNDFGLGAGIDLSPALAICLGAEIPSSWSGEVSWRFADADEVSDGPWRQIITTSDPNW